MSFLERTASVFPDKPAVVHGNRCYTYRQLAERVNRLASGPRNAGLQKQERMGCLADGVALHEGWRRSYDIVHQLPSDTF